MNKFHLHPYYHRCHKKEILPFIKEHLLEDICKIVTDYF
jgi:hypothetical protein